MEIITGVERRRRWSVAEKLRIVAETERRGLLWNWRSQVRRGVLRPEAPAVFVPVRVIGEKHAEPSAAIDPDATVTASKIEITLPDGSSIRVGHDVSLVTLRRVVSVLRG